MMNFKILIVFCFVFFGLINSEIYIANTPLFLIENWSSFESPVTINVSTPELFYNSSIQPFPIYFIGNGTIKFTSSANVGAMSIISAVNLDGGGFTITTNNITASGSKFENVRIIATEKIAMGNCNTTNSFFDGTKIDLSKIRDINSTWKSPNFDVHNSHISYVDGGGGFISDTIGDQTWNISSGGVTISNCTVENLRSDIVIPSDNTIKKFYWESSNNSLSGDLTFAENVFASNIRITGPVSHGKKLYIDDEIRISQGSHEFQRFQSQKLTLNCDPVGIKKTFVNVTEFFPHLISLNTCEKFTDPIVIFQEGNDNFEGDDFRIENYGNGFALFAGSDNIEDIGLFSFFGLDPRLVLGISISIGGLFVIAIIWIFISIIVNKKKRSKNPSERGESSKSSSCSSPPYISTSISESSHYEKYKEESEEDSYEESEEDSYEESYEYA